jgi:hypothetical protein
MGMDKNFSIGGRDFQLGKLDPFKQFHIVRRVGPLLADLVPVMKDLKKSGEGGSEDEKLEMIAKIAGPIMSGLSKLSDEDANLVLFGLLSSIEMKQTTGNWAKVATPAMLMVQDIDLPVLLQLAGRSFVYNLSGFFAGLPHSS